MNELRRQTIKLYARQLRIPAFNNYSDVICQLDREEGFEDFLIRLMKMELDSRQVNIRRRRIKASGFPYIKTINELDYSRFEYMNKAFIKGLSSYNFVL